MQPFSHIPFLLPANVTPCLTLWLFDVPINSTSSDTYTATYNAKTGEVRVYDCHYELVIDWVYEAIVRHSMDAQFDQRPAAPWDEEDRFEGDEIQQWYSGDLALSFATCGGMM